MYCAFIFIQYVFSLQTHQLINNKVIFVNLSSQFAMLRNINFMNNNKTESYQKLRALYQHKFFNENCNEQVLNTHNLIKFKRNLQSPYTQHLQKSSPSVPHNKKATGSKHKQITIQYEQIQTEVHSLPSSWNQIIPQTSRAKPRSNKIFLNLKTLGFPFTSRESPSPISKLHPKKHSLMEMIEELRKLKQTETSNIQLSQGRKDKVYQQYKCRHNTESIRGNNKRQKRNKMSASYNSSNPNTARIEKKVHLISNESKTNGIDPWNVSDNDFQSKKYF